MNYKDFITDINAAINLNNYTPSVGVKACPRDGKFHDVSQVAVSEEGIRQLIKQPNVQLCVSS